jgi:DNA-binding response OmpR family regulator
MKKILVVEDDPVNSHVLSEFLRAYGYGPVVAHDGVEGVELFRRERPDLVIIDILLPFKNGYEVFDDVRSTKDGQRTPVFMMSAVFDEIDDVHALLPPERRAQAYFTKPFDLTALMDHVQFFTGG